MRGRDIKVGVDYLVDAGIFRIVRATVVSAGPSPGLWRVAFNHGDNRIETSQPSRAFLEPWALREELRAAHAAQQEAERVIHDARRARWAALGLPGEVIRWQGVSLHGGEIDALMDRVEGKASA